MKTKKSPAVIRKKAVRSGAAGRKPANTRRASKAVVKTGRKASPGRAPTRRVVRRKAMPGFPPILLEGDLPAPPPVSGPGEKFVLGPTPPGPHSGPPPAALPEAYGTGRLFLTARDPHWLYANWDFAREQQARHNRQSMDGHLILRIYDLWLGGGPVSEIHVHPESRHWFAHVERAATKYRAEIGYYNRARKWISLATSGTTLAPPDQVAEDATAAFATIPLEVPFETLLALVKEAAGAHRPLAQALEELRREGHPDLPAGIAGPAAAWTPGQEAALADVVSMDEVRRVWIGSLEITELIRREVGRGISSMQAAQFGLPTPPGGAVAAVTSWAGGARPPEKGFWFNVNAELIVYGATERDANVTIGGRKIMLRPDGSFSFRFALPDGRYDLPVVAVSADGTDGRAAELKFTRATEIRGDVGAQPQDPDLKTPTPDNV